MGSGFSFPGWGLLVLDLSLAGILLVVPLRQPSRDDHGDGLAHVVLPANRPASPWRTLFFYVALAGSSTLLLGVTGLVPSYRAVVSRVVLQAYGHPALVPVYAGHVDAGLRVLVVLDLVCLTLTVPAGPGRRLALGLHAVGFLVLSIGLDALLIIVSISVHLPIGSYAFVATVANLAAASLVMLRILVTTFSLPGPSRLVPHGTRRAAAVVFGVALIAVIALLLAVLALLTLVAASHPNVGLALFLGYPVLFSALFIILLTLGGRARRPALNGPPPPLEVIMPAYNEADGIADNLLAIDRAAACYEGPVHVVVGDDGSTDQTTTVAEAAMRQFTAASGHITHIPHQGKASALNAALAETTADIVIRIDADVIVHPKALAGVPRWFTDPTVGTVGAFMMPDPRGRSFFHRMRAFECLISFGFARPALSRVDAVSCIPGTFAAFRRAPAVRFGGFVTGMNGEDADLTLQLGRLGYRAVIDPAIISFEDVPGTLSSFRAQRLRWNRAGIQVMSRHSPLSSGESSPRTWFLFLRTGLIRITSLLRPLVYIHAFQVAIFVPALRREIGFVGLLYLLGALPSLIPIVVLSFRHGHWRKLGWMLCWYPYSVLRRVIVLESLLTLPPRPILQIAGSPARFTNAIERAAPAANTTRGYEPGG
jgi:cellulose synthase/poly-beta-1,6-N-acetylglucosamine synthase-like glycosyltransferase